MSLPLRCRNLAALSLPEPRGLPLLNRLMPPSLTTLQCFNAELSSRRCSFPESVRQANVRRRASYRYERNFRNSGLISLEPRTVLLDGILLLVLGAFSLAQAAQPVNLAGDTSTLAPASTPTPLPSPYPDATLFSNGPSNVVQRWNDGTPVELGVKFKSAAAGRITAIRFYKALANTSRHAGNLWSESGTLLASVNFNNETASGWQQATLSNPVTITAGTIYVAPTIRPSIRVMTTTSQQPCIHGAR